MVCPTIDLVSPDVGLLCLCLCGQVDTTGYETYDIYFKDLQTGEMLPDVIKGVAGGLVWGADNSVVREQDCACGEE